LVGHANLNYGRQNQSTKSRHKQVATATVDKHAVNADAHECIEHEHAIEY